MRQSIYCILSHSRAMSVVDTSKQFQVWSHAQVRGWFQRNEHMRVTISFCVFEGRESKTHIASQVIFFVLQNPKPERVTHGPQFFQFWYPAGNCNGRKLKSVGHVGSIEKLQGESHRLPWIHILVLYSRAKTCCQATFGYMFIGLVEVNRSSHHSMNTIAF